VNAILPRAEPVDGPTALPAGYPHPHASEEARAIAEAGLILRVQVGSGVHGTAIDGQDDRDEMGLCLEPPQFVTGLARVPNGIRGATESVRFEQYERHTAWDRPGGLANRSGAGDLDVSIYSARKWARLALAGNPTVLLVLFVPEAEVAFRSQAGAELTDNAHRFVSRLAAARFLGYLRAQRAAMTGGKGAHTNRPELVALHGYDTKHAMHALRLGLQGMELLTTGRITVPVPEPDRGYLRAIRRGEVPLAEAAVTSASGRPGRGERAGPPRVTASATTRSRSRPRPAAERGGPARPPTPGQAQASHGASSPRAPRDRRRTGPAPATSPPG
jgi:hypothetical protein